jgi:hypothetical protein
MSQEAKTRATGGVASLLLASGLLPGMAPGSVFWPTGLAVLVLGLACLGVIAAVVGTSWGRTVHGAVVAAGIGIGLVLAAALLAGSLSSSASSVVGPSLAWSLAQIACGATWIWMNHAGSAR